MMKIIRIMQENPPQHEVTYLLPLKVNEDGY